MQRKLFDEVTKLKDLISADEQEKNGYRYNQCFFKEHKLTYNQSFEILDLVKVTLFDSVQSSSSLISSSGIAKSFQFSVPIVESNMGEEAT